MGLVGGILLLPVFLLTAALSIPYVLVMRRIQDHKEKLFQQRMKREGRSIEWPEFIQRMGEAGGTVIIEWYFPKGPTRWWWTSDNVRALSPYPLPNSKQVEIGFLTEHGLAGDWCHERYTNISDGGARLVAGTHQHIETLNQLRESANLVVLHRR